MGAADIAEAHQRAMDLDQREYDRTANWAARMLDFYGAAYCHLSPGDGTRYEITIVRPPSDKQDRMNRHDFARNDSHGFEFNGRNEMYVATQFSTLAPWQGQEIGEIGYIESHFFHRATNPNIWSVTMLFRFLNTLAQTLKEYD